MSVGDLDQQLQRAQQQLTALQQHLLSQSAQRDNTLEKLVALNATLVAAQKSALELQQYAEQERLMGEKVSKYESMLKRITDKVRDSLDESQILQAAVQELTLVLGLAGCNSALYDLDQGTSTVRYEYTNSIPTLYGRVAQMDHSPEIYHQLKSGHYFQFCSLFPNPERGRVAMLACPIFVDPSSSQGIDQAVLGDLWLIHRYDYVFNEFEIRLAEQVANQCAIAIRQARLYQAAQVQVQELERLNQLKDQFLSTVSHELRTPIANVKMAIHMLKVSSTDDKRQQYMGILESELKREAELIDDLLDLQRLEEAAFPIEVGTIDLKPWLEQTVAPFRSRISSYQQTLEIVCPDDLPSLTSDPGILRRILAELLNNACKYTPRGEMIQIETCHQQENASPQTPHTIITLKNEAEIPFADLPHIFDKFYRVIQVDRYKHGGTGLGLALVKKLVEQVGGTIQADSANGWTVFTLRVPHLK